MLARDGARGYVEDLLVDDEWRVPAIIVAIPAWLREQTVLLLPEMVEQIDYARGAVRIRLTQAELMRRHMHA